MYFTVRKCVAIILLVAAFGIHWTGSTVDALWTLGLAIFMEAGAER